MATPIKPKDTQEACNPVSSNCVIWQGPDIPCINLCNGDSVSDVVAKMAHELCIILDEIKISAYDLSCFDPLCPTPTSFKEMIQLLIDKVCDLYNVDPTTVTNGCPDCVVNVAPCLITQDNLGNDITTLQLRDYVILIGNRICSLIANITSQGDSIKDLYERVTQIEENCCNQSNVPTVATSCINPNAINIPVTAFASALESAFCALQETTGTVTALQTAIGKQCLGLSSETPLDPAQGAGTMGEITGWSISPITVADSLNNLWLTVCDMRAGLVDLISQVNACCAVSCSSILLDYNVSFDGDKTIQILSSGSFPSGYDFCTNSSVTITGSNGSTYVYNNVSLELPSTTIDISTNPPSPPFVNSIYYYVTIQACYTDGDSQCVQTTEVFTVDGKITCPTLTLANDGVTPQQLIAGFTVTAPISAGVSYQVILKQTSTGIPVAVWNVPSTTPTGAITYPFTGLLNSTSYTAELTMFQGSVFLSCTPVTAVTITPPPGP